MTDTKRPGGPIVHDLKTWPNYFAAVADGSKPFEIRKNDRDFCVDDILCLREWFDPGQRYTGRAVVRRISYVLESGPGVPGLAEDHVILGLVDPSQT